VTLYRSQIKRVVITSSILAVLSTVKEGVTRKFNEDDWADEFVELVKEQGNKSSADAKYRASKTLAEKGRPSKLDTLR
jgi:hypothetical protein